MQGEDVRMRQRRDGFGFAIEARQPLRITRDGFRKNLDRDVSIESRIARAIDLSHPAGPKRAQDFVSSEAAAGRERHWRVSLAAVRPFDVTQAVRVAGD